MKFFFVGFDCICWNCPDTLHAEFVTILFKYFPRVRELKRNSFLKDEVLSLHVVSSPMSSVAPAPSSKASSHTKLFFKTFSSLVKTLRFAYVLGTLAVVEIQFLSFREVNPHKNSKIWTPNPRKHYNNVNHYLSMIVIVVVFSGLPHSPLQKLEDFGGATT